MVRDGKFAKVGTREECERAAGGDFKFIELDEGCAVPGIIDAHGHPLLHGRMLAEVQLQGAKSEQECVERVARYSQFVPSGQWIRGGGWDQNAWPGRDFPSRGLVSAAIANRRYKVRKTKKLKLTERMAAAPVRSLDPRSVSSASGSTMPEWK